ncbi:MAG TPA: peptidoglycan DD-metalloendopeptidase family protein [Acidimicrobiales bacterium]|nr:peptidoglycan DD-metalloendopeptidase family protein [Acidimicrobiales bacterium]
MAVRTQAIRRRIAVITATSFVFASASAAPAQEDPSNDGDSTEQALIEINVNAADGDPAAIAGALGDLATNVEAQLGQLSLAQVAVREALRVLTDRETAIADTEARIEAIVGDSDAVVIRAFINPPDESAIEVFTEPSVNDATVKKAILDMQTETDAGIIEQYQKERLQLIDDKEAKEVALEEAEQAKADAEAALADLEAAVSQQTQFVLDVRDRLNKENADPEGLADNPDVAAGISALAGKLQDIEDAHAYEEAQAALAEAQQRLIAQGNIVCPVGGTVNFGDTWGAARSGGRSHQGTDMMAASGTPAVAPTNGDMVHKASGLGGTTYYVYGDNGHTYYGAHLSAYEGGERHVQAGETIGYVGSSGNASASAPHLHFEFHPNGGSAVNPYDLLDRACPSH